MSGGGGAWERAGVQGESAGTEGSLSESWPRWAAAQPRANYLFVPAQSRNRLPFAQSDSEEPDETSPALLLSGGLGSALILPTRDSVARK